MLCDPDGALEGGPWAEAADVGSVLPGEAVSTLAKALGLSLGT